MNISHLRCKAKACNGLGSRFWAACLIVSSRYSRPAILCAAGAEAVAAEHWPARLWFERHAVRFAALVANNLEFFAFGSAAAGALTRTAKVLAPGIAARLATLGMAQAALAIVILFSFAKGKSSSAFGTRYFKVWHRYLPRKVFLRFVYLTWAKFTPAKRTCTATESAEILF
jgi:hypothetical protein